MGEELDVFFKILVIPSLSEMDRKELGLPIIMEKIQRVTQEMASQKCLGPDGLPNETYQHYGKVLLPELVWVLNWSIMGGRDPL